MVIMATKSCDYSGQSEGYRSKCTIWLVCRESLIIGVHVVLYAYCMWTVDDCVPWFIGDGIVWSLENLQELCTHVADTATH